MHPGDMIGGGVDDGPDYEITTDEWKSDNPGHFWGTPMCVNCHRPLGFHFQTAEGKLFCLRYPTAKTGDDHGV